MRVRWQGIVFIVATTFSVHVACFSSPLPLIRYHSKPTMQHLARLAELRPARSSFKLKMQESAQADKHDGVSDMSTFFNLVKAIVGAGSFALPWVCKNEGVLGGTLTIIGAGVVSAYTMKQLVGCKNFVAATSPGAQSELSYVDVARAAFGDAGAKFVFFCTVTASLGVCSAYVAFIGTTLETLSIQDGLIHSLFAGTSKDTFQLATAAVLFPITCLRSFSFLSFTSTLGTISVFAALAAVSQHVLAEHGGLAETAAAVSSLPLWPQSAGAYFQSFGSVAFLFCINFLILPVERAMRRPSRFPWAVNAAVAATVAANALFGALGLSLYRDDTLDVVTNNLGPGPLLEAVRLLLCVDLLLTYPLVFVTGREIMEGWLLPPPPRAPRAPRASGRAPRRAAGAGCGLGRKTRRFGWAWLGLPLRWLILKDSDLSLMSLEASHKALLPS